MPMHNHWSESFLTFLLSFDVQMPQGHWHNLVNPWHFLQIGTSVHNDWESLKHLLFKYRNYVLLTPTTRIMKSFICLQLVHWLVFCFCFLNHCIFRVNAPVPNIPYSITTDQYLSAMDTCTNFESNIPVCFSIVKQYSITIAYMW